MCVKNKSPPIPCSSTSSGCLIQYVILAKMNLHVFMIMCVGLSTFMPVDKN